MHLTECFAPLIAYVLRLHDSAQQNQKSVEQVRTEILDILREGESLAGEGKIAPEEYLNARFAVCAWVDETILNSEWPQKDRWLKEELQQKFYKTSEAGEEFFQRLKDLPAYQREVREVYYLCLSLGFTGRHCGSGGEQALDQLRGAQLAALTGSANGIFLQDKDLFPAGYPQDLPAAGKDTGKISFMSLPALVALAAPLLLFAALVVAFRFALAGVADNFLNGTAF